MSTSPSPLPYGRLGMNRSQGQTACTTLASVDWLAGRRPTQADFFVKMSFLFYPPVMALSFRSLLLGL